MPAAPAHSSQITSSFLRCRPQALASKKSLKAVIKLSIADDTPGTHMLTRLLSMRIAKTFHPLARRLSPTPLFAKPGYVVINNVVVMLPLMTVF